MGKMGNTGQRGMLESRLRYTIPAKRREVEERVGQPRGIYFNR